MRNVKDNFSESAKVDAPSKETVSTFFINNFTLTHL